MWLAAGVAVFAACAEDPGLDPAAVGGDEIAETDDAKGDAAGGLYDYFTIRPADDGSRSWFVQRINRSTIECSDGTVLPYCTVPSVTLMEGLDDPAASSELFSFDITFRGHSDTWGRYFAPALVRGELQGDGLVISEIWRSGRSQQPIGVWVELSTLGASGTTCADASWATACESRLNSRSAWPISISNLLDVPHEVQSAEREALLDPARRTVVVGARRYFDGLPVRDLSNIYLRMTSLAQ